MRTGAVLTIEVDHHVKDSPLNIVRLFNLKYELLCDSIHTISSGAMKIVRKYAIPLAWNKRSIVYLQLWHIRQ